MISMRHGAQDALAAIEIDREARRLQKEADASLVQATEDELATFLLRRIDYDTPAAETAHDAVEFIAAKIREQKT